MAAASDGTMVWYARNSAGLWDAYIGNGECQGTPLLPAYAGNRGPADITADGRYVLLTTAVGWEKTLPFSSPGRGSQNAIQLYDRATGKLSTLLAGATSSQRGVIWPKFNANDTKIAWSQMLKTPAEVPPVGRWALHVADVDLETGTLTDNIEWQDPNGEPAFYEAYGWIPNTNLLIFMSTTQATSTGFGKAQLFTLPDNLDPSTTPTRISPPYPSLVPGQPPTDAYHEFAAFAPGDPYTLYTSIVADTVGGDDLFAYDLRTQEPDGLLAPPTRISYFGGDVALNGGTQAIPGWPAPSYTVVTTMAWINESWIATTCPDILCEHVNAWRINLSSPTPTVVRPTGSGSLSGLASRKPTLRLHATHTASGPDIASLSIALPAGLHFNRKALSERRVCTASHSCARSVTVHGLSLSGASIASASISTSKLVLAFTHTTASVSLSARPPLLVESEALMRKAKRHQTGKLTVHVRITDASGTTTLVSVR